MSDELGTYSFLPWLRLGVANNIESADGDPAVELRATMQVDLTLTGSAVDGDGELTEPVSRSVALYGPGDVVGIDPRAVVKHEPRDGITNFEPNYMPYLEFYEEDFPWRYTPAAPDEASHRLRPWLALVVLEAGEFADARPTSKRPLPAIEVTAPADDVFPPADQLWAWAHVHLNRDLIQQAGSTLSSDAATLRGRVAALLANNPDHAYSRLLSPRRLRPETGYHAFLVPSFESGRLAGLGSEPDLDNPAFFATQSAWAAYDGRPLPALHPYYLRWSFKTGTLGDFEYLVRLLQPRPPDARLGRRDMDVQEPGSNLPGIADPALEGVLRLGGALQVPAEALSNAEEAEAEKYESWDQPYPHPFQEALARFVNLTDDYAAEGVPDPVIAPPIYGRWHALTERVLFDRDDGEVPQDENWVHELNLDPRWRVAAGFGTEVIQDKQEEYMDAAWEQVGDILEANRRIRFAQLAREVAGVWHRRHLGPLAALSRERALALTAPVQRRVFADRSTVHYAVARSTVPRAALSAPMRRALRPRDHVAGRLGLGGPLGADGLIDGINRGDVSAAPPREVPDDLPTVEEVAEPEPPKKKKKWKKKRQRGKQRFYGLLPEASSPEQIDRLPPFPDFAILDPPRRSAPEPRPGRRDSAEAERFKTALGDGHRLLAVSASLGEPPERRPLDLTFVAEATFTGIDPQVTVPAFTYASISFPLHLVAINLETFREAMAYPEFDDPMYKPLLGLSSEHFLPNIDKLPPNTITLLETNQRFIEAYMVGLNHEFGRELLWREFPTDQRGSYFRQFWDPSGVIDRQGLSKEELREKLRDIPPLHLWSRFSNLGDHDHREQEGDLEEEIVMVVRGELLKRYPTAVIYAQKARWRRDEQGEIDPTQERELEDQGAAEDILRTPLYEARVDPDVTFLGFDLTAEEVKGGSGQPGDEEPGWFFVIKERPGEPRFGLDVERDGPLEVWNDLAWADVTDDDDRFLRVGPGSPTHTLDDEPSEPEKVEQWQEDRALSWRPGTNAAELAYILYQVPVLVAVHGDEMLPR